MLPWSTTVILLSLEDLAEYYAQVRNIPAQNLIGISLPERGQISRIAYNTSLRDPLRNAFSARGWWTFGRTAEGMIMPATCKITTVVCMRGVPFKIGREVIPAEQADKPSQTRPSICPCQRSLCRFRTCHDGHTGNSDSGPTE